MCSDTVTGLIARVKDIEIDGEKRRRIAGAFQGMLMQEHNVAVSLFRGEDLKVMLDGKGPVNGIKRLLPTFREFSYYNYPINELDVSNNEGFQEFEEMLRKRGYKIDGITVTPGRCDKLPLIGWRSCHPAACLSVKPV